MSDTNFASARHLETDFRYSYIDWSSVLSGALIGTAIFFTFTTFGSGIGLSLTSPYLGEGVSGKATALAVGIWTLWVVISSFLAAGYIAGRMRHYVPDISTHESELRDGAHGLVAWAVTTLFGSILAVITVTGLTHETQSNSTSLSHIQYVADSMLRGDKVQGQYDAGLHREIASILEAAVTNKVVTPQDHAFLVRNVIAHTGYDSAASEARVDAAIKDVQDTANSARKLGVIGAFLAAAALAVGASAAWWAATMGGLHRQDYNGVSIFTRWH